MKEEKVEVDETFSMRFEDPIPAKRIKQEPVEERKAFVEVATQTETLENDVEVLKFSLVLKSEIQNLKQRVDSGFKEADERMARIQETIEKSDGLNSKQAVLVKPKVTSEVDKSQPQPFISNSFHKKRRRVVSDVLKKLNVRFSDPVWKPCFKKLLEICIIYSSDIPRDDPGTPEILAKVAKVAKDHAEQVIKLEKASHSQTILVEDCFDESEIASGSGLGDKPGEKTKRIRRCGECKGCQRKDCGKCSSCQYRQEQDRLEFVGGHRLDKPEPLCIWRICKLVDPLGKN